MPTLPAPLTCQRHLFDLPEDVAYLDAAAWGALPHPVQAAAAHGMRTKTHPWSQRPDLGGAAITERARAAAAALIGARPDDVAIVGAISHAMATAARNLHPTPGGRLLRVTDEYPSHRLVWDRVAAEHGLDIEEVPCPPDGDWAAALLEAIARPGAAPLTLATLTPLHWADGTLIDLDRVAPAVHAAGAALVIDATQAVGAIPVDVARWQPDFLAFPTYKWALGPYGVAFLYAAPHRQGGTPLEATSSNQHAAGARRYDRGEVADPLLLPMAAAGLELVASWDSAALAARLRHLTDALAEGAQALGLAAPPQRVPHILGLRRPGGLPPGLVEQLQAAQVFVCNRLGALRISPHAWAHEGDVARCLAALGAALSKPVLS